MTPPLVAPKTKRPVVVHIGNVGYPDKQPAHTLAQRTREMARKFRRLTFVGIDRQPIKPDRPNWKQITATFDKGLQAFQDNSIDHISSEMAIGHYGQKGIEKRDAETNTAACLRLAHQKLKPGAKLFLTVGETALPRIERQILKNGFLDTHVTVRRLKKTEYQRGFWTRHGKLGDRYLVIATKENPAGKKQSAAPTKHSKPNRPSKNDS